MSENPEFNPALQIIAAMGLVIGEEIMAIPVAGGGTGFQGVLKTVIMDADNHPAIFVIYNQSDPDRLINVFARNLAMVSRVQQLTPVSDVPIEGTVVNR